MWLFAACLTLRGHTRVVQPHATRTTSVGGPVCSGLELCCPPGAPLSAPHGCSAGCMEVCIDADEDAEECWQWVTAREMKGGIRPTREPCSGLAAEDDYELVEAGDVVDGMALVLARFIVSHPDYKVHNCVSPWPPGIGLGCFSLRLPVEWEAPPGALGGLPPTCSLSCPISIRGCVCFAWPSEIRHCRSAPHFLPCRCFPPAMVVRALCRVSLRKTFRQVCV